MTKPSVLLANRPIPGPTIVVLALLTLSLIVVGISLARGNPGVSSASPEILPPSV